MTQAPFPGMAIFALIGESFTCDAFEPLYQRSLAERARRQAHGRGLRRSDGRRWHASSELLTLPMRAAV